MYILIHTFGYMCKKPALEFGNNFSLFRRSVSRKNREKNSKKKIVLFEVCENLKFF